MRTRENPGTDGRTRGRGEPGENPGRTRGEPGGRTRGQTGRFLLFCLPVARLARVIAVDVLHHITQRGNARRFILDCDAEDGQRSTVPTPGKMCWSSTASVGNVPSVPGFPGFLSPGFPGFCPGFCPRLSVPRCVGMIC